MARPSSPSTDTTYSKAAREPARQTKSRDLPILMPDPVRDTQDMESGLKEFAAGVEHLVGHVVTGDLAGGLAQNMNTVMVSFIRQFESR